MNPISRLFLSKNDRERIAAGDKAIVTVEKAKEILIHSHEQKALGQYGGATVGNAGSSLDILRNVLIGQGFISAPTFQNVNTFIQEGFNANAAVYSIIMNTSKKFSTIPWGLYKVRKGQEKKAAEYKILTSGRMMTTAALTRALLLKDMAFDEVESDQLLEFWNKPNKEQSGAEFRESAMAFKMLTGSAPIYSNRGISGVKPVEMLVLPTQFVQLWPSQANLFEIGAATFNITGAMVPIPIDQMLYWKYWNPNFDVTGQHLYGQAPLRAAGLTVAADNQNTKSQEFMMRNTGVPGIFVPDGMDVAAAANEQADQIRDTLADLLNAREAGTQGKPYQNLPMKYISFGLDAEKLQLVDIQRLTAERLAAVWNYPPALINQERTTDNNYQNAVKYLVTNTIYADLCSFRDNYANAFYLKQWGRSPSEWFMDFDITNLPEMQEDMQKQAESLARMDYLTYDEKRVVAKYDRKGGAYDTSYVSAGLVPIEKAFSGDDTIDPDLL